MATTTPVRPTDDARWKMVDTTMRRLGHGSDALIEALHTVQDAFGYLSPESLRYVAETLRVPLSRAYGVATFYHFFTLDPPGDHQCILCTGTACYIKGVPAIVEAIREEFGVDEGQTTADGRFSLQSARCLGSCGHAPAAVFDTELAGKVTPDDAVERIRGWVDHGDH